MNKTSPHLLLIVDVNPLVWGSFGKEDCQDIAPTISFSQFFEQTMTFVSSYLLSGEGSITILCTTPTSSSFLPITTTTHCTIQNLSEIRSQFLNFVQEQTVASQKEHMRESYLAGSLSKAMCCLFLFI